jgi:hypothetical protein
MLQCILDMALPQMKEFAEIDIRANLYITQGRLK